MLKNKRFWDIGQENNLVNLYILMVIGDVTTIQNFRTNLKSCSGNTN